MIVLVGAPGSGKAEITKTLIQDKRHIRPFVGFGQGSRGALADYRTELYLASQRALAHQGMLRSFGTDKLVLAHSLIDSVAYATVKLHELIGDDSVDDEMLQRWVMTAGLIGQFMTDSFKADKIFYLPNYSREDDYNEKIDDALVITMESFGLQYKTLSTSEEINDAINTGRSDPEPQGQDQGS